jgi:hypothetical protein
LALAAAIPACESRPLREGAQITRVPEGFLFDANLSYARLVFPERVMVRQRGYATPGEDVYGAIVITEYAGAIGEAAIREARAAIEARYRQESYGPVESTIVAERPAWAWFERQTWKGRTSVAYHAVIPWDAATTYTVEFSSNDPRTRGEDFMRETVASFVVAKHGRPERPRKA